MRSLFAFLWKYQFTVFFILLEGIALILLFNSYTYHKTLAFNTINDFTGGVFSISSDVSGYFNLKEENKQLLLKKTPGCAIFYQPRLIRTIPLELKGIASIS